MLLVLCRLAALTMSFCLVLACGASVLQPGSSDGKQRTETAGDANATVQRVESELPEGGFHAVAVVDNNNLWAVGLEGDELSGSRNFVTLNSTDLGFTWTRTSSIPDCHLSDIYFHNAQTGWVVGSDARHEGLILHTTDGGQSWSRQQSSAKRALSRVRFISETRGWILGSSGQVLRTNDGGAHWFRQRLPLGLVRDELQPRLIAFSFADESNGWIVGEMGQVYQSTDGGASWQSRALQLGRVIKVDKPRRIDFEEVRFFNNRVGCMITQVVDRDDDGIPKQYLKKLSILRTGNGGRDWVLRRTLKTPTIVGAYFLNENEWWLRTSSQTLFQTTDGGKTWSEVKPDVYYASMRVMLFVDAKIGWLLSFPSGLYGENLLTRDGGKTWTAQTINYITRNSGTPKR